MANYPRFDYSNREVKRAGEVIASDLIWTDETAPRIREAFAIANNWRDSHAFPMRSIRYSAGYFMRKYGLEGITAARLKRCRLFDASSAASGLAFTNFKTWVGVGSFCRPSPMCTL